MKPAPAYTTLADVQAGDRIGAGSDERREANATPAINRFAWAVKDLRALGLAGSWTVRLRDGDQSAALIIEMHDDATAEQASDAIWGDMKS
ncbi:hypothetical protein [Caulobacter sp. Root343]|uniref:hypothetical protein n=1 Tax=Caulobacter sp. Root343 TaxID=1736520 RepID=UPI0006F42FB5|nr:hypothetical protein [Caulobacter sp. Root343]KQV66597.1 hypothetical protein ASC70_12245 [Caulobacter sp. Root343]